MKEQASTQVHDLNDPDMAGDVLTMDEVVAEFGYTVRGMDYAVAAGQIAGQQAAPSRREGDS